MIHVLSALADVAQIAHITNIPHQEPVPAPSGGGGGGASVAVIIVGVLVTLAAAGGLVWVKRRTDA